MGREPKRRALSLRLGCRPGPPETEPSRNLLRFPSSLRTDTLTDYSSGNGQVPPLLFHGLVREGFQPNRIEMHRARELQHILVRIDNGQELCSKTVRWWPGRIGAECILSEDFVFLATGLVKCSSSGGVFRLRVSVIEQGRQRECLAPSDPVTGSHCRMVLAKCRICDGR
jgi:hypothetical protein